MVDPPVSWRVEKSAYLLTPTCHPHRIYQDGVSERGLRRYRAGDGRDPNFRLPGQYAGLRASLSRADGREARVPPS